MERRGVRGVKQLSLFESPKIEFPFVAETKEEWKTIPFAQRYEASTYGRFRNKKSGRIVKGTIAHNGYIHVGFIINYGETQRWFLAHRVIVMTFIREQEGDEVVNHKDGNRANNKLSNLEWVSRRENALHWIKNKF